MSVDKLYCMSSYLIYRYVVDENKRFYENLPIHNVNIDFKRQPVKDAAELLRALRQNINAACADGKAALALSGGIDSAILAKLVPRGTKAYTFKCVVPGINTFNEAEPAIHRAKECGLNHEVIEIYWEDIEAVTDTLMRHKGAPIHSIETQIYIAAKKAKKDGFDKLIFGETADIIYGGLDGLLSKNWQYAEFIERYSYVLPYKVLRRPQMIVEPYLHFEENGYIDPHTFINYYLRQEALGSYTNACQTAGIEFIAPYSKTEFACPLDYERVRNGDSKYIIRELFTSFYRDAGIPKKTPMPRPMNEWFAGWPGPQRPEFIPHCTDNMSGDQKWMVWCLERFLNMGDGNNG